MTHLGILNVFNRLYIFSFLLVIAMRTSTHLANNCTSVNSQLSSGSLFLSWEQYSKSTAGQNSDCWGIKSMHFLDFWRMLKLRKECLQSSTAIAFTATDMNSYDKALPKTIKGGKVLMVF